MQRKDFVVVVVVTIGHISLLIFFLVPSKYKKEELSRESYTSLTIMKVQIKTTSGRCNFTPASLREIRERGLLCVAGENGNQESHQGGQTRASTVFSLNTPCILQTESKPSVLQRHLSVHAYCGTIYSSLIMQSVLVSIDK